MCIRTVNNIEFGKKLEKIRLDVANGMEIIINIEAKKNLQN